MPRRQTISRLDRARQRAEQDSDFHAQVLADDRATQAACRLSAADWRSLVGTVTELEQQRHADPLAATEADHGAADAAGVKD